VSSGGGNTHPPTRAAIPLSCPRPKVKFNSTCAHHSVQLGYSFVSFNPSSLTNPNYMSRSTFVGPVPQYHTLMNILMCAGQCFWPPLMHLTFQSNSPPRRIGYRPIGNKVLDASRIHCPTVFGQVQSLHHFRLCQPSACPVNFSHLH